MSLSSNSQSDKNGCGGPGTPPMDEYCAWDNLHSDTGDHVDSRSEEVLQTIGNVVVQIKKGKGNIMRNAERIMMEQPEMVAELIKFEDEYLSTLALTIKMLYAHNKKYEEPFEFDETAYLGERTITDGTTLGALMDRIKRGSFIGE